VKSERIKNTVNKYFNYTVGILYLGTSLVTNYYCQNSLACLPVTVSIHFPFPLKVLEQNGS
jgi:hypothetical protein